MYTFFHANKLDILSHAETVPKRHLKIQFPSIEIERIHILYRTHHMVYRLFKKSISCV